MIGNELLQQMIEAGDVINDLEPHEPVQVPAEWAQAIEYARAYVGSLSGWAAQLMDMGVNMLEAQVARDPAEARLYTLAFTQLLARSLEFTHEDVFPEGPLLIEQATPATDEQSS
jgi:hypothetical protein